MQATARHLMPIRPIRAVFLDLDDTIGCRPQRVRAALAHVCSLLSRTDLDLDALVARTIDPLERGPAPDHVPALVRTEARFRAMIEELAPADPAMLAVAEQVFATDYSALCFFPEVEETLAHLADRYLLGIISNAPARQMGKVTHLRLDRFVRHVTLSGVVGYEKPDPRIFAAALAEAGVRAGEAVFVGDRLNVDVAGAKTAGLWAVWCNHRGDPTIDGLPSPNITIDRFAELPGALTTMARP
ncbi:MAG: HAD family hydrolase [Dehalococcoidia bacterium]